MYSKTWPISSRRVGQDCRYGQSMTGIPAGAGPVELSGSRPGGLTTAGDSARRDQRRRPLGRQRALIGLRSR
jgi:hypothetical protein